MPAFSSTNEKVLVTGASGFIATWLIRTLLEKGYAVRGTVRSKDKGQEWEEWNPEYKGKVECGRFFVFRYHFDISALELLTI